MTRGSLEDKREQAHGSTKRRQAIKQWQLHADQGGAGHVALIGVLSGLGASDTSLFTLVSKNARASGIHVGARRF